MLVDAARGLAAPAHRQANCRPTTRCSWDRPTDRTRTAGLHSDGSSTDACVLARQQQRADALVTVGGGAIRPSLARQHLDRGRRSGGSTSSWTRAPPTSPSHRRPPPARGSLKSTSHSHGIQIAAGEEPGAAGAVRRRREEHELLAPSTAARWSLDGWATCRAPARGETVPHRRPLRAPTTAAAARAPPSAPRGAHRPASAPELLSASARRSRRASRHASDAFSWSRPLARALLNARARRSGGWRTSRRLDV